MIPRATISIAMETLGMDKFCTTITETTQSIVALFKQLNINRDMTK